MPLVLAASVVLRQGEAEAGRHDALLDGGDGDVLRVRGGWGGWDGGGRGERVMTVIGDSDVDVDNTTAMICTS